MTFRGNFSFAADAAGQWDTSSIYGPPQNYGYTIRPYVAGYGGGNSCAEQEWTIVICSLPYVDNHDPNNPQEVTAYADVAHNGPDGHISHQ